MVDDRVRIAHDALAMKGRSHHLALSHVNRIVGCDQPLPQQDLHPLQGPLLHKRATLVDENLADICRIVHEHDVRPHEAVLGDWPVRRLQVFKQPDRLTQLHPALQPVKGQGMLQTGRKVVGGRPRALLRGGARGGIL